MELRPGYKQTEVGVIPEEWEVARVGDVAVVEGGYAFSSKKFVRDGKYQVVKMSNLYGGTLDLQRSASFLDKIEDQEKHYVLRRDEILITLTGTTGKRDYGYSHKIGHERNLLLNQRVARLIVGEAANPSYVAFQIKMPSFMDQFFDVSKGGTGNQTNVGTRDVEAIYIPLPPPPEQRAIAAALGDVDALIDALDRLIAKNRDLKQAAMQLLLTGRQRLPSFHEKWREVPFKYIYNDIFKKSPISSSDGAKDGAFPLFVSGGEVKRIERALYSNTEALIFSDGGVFDVRYFAGDFSVTDHCYVVSIRGDMRFYFYWLSLHKGKLDSLTFKGSGLRNLDKTALGNIKVPLPHESEQTAIAAVLSDMDAEIAALEARRDKTRALKQGMMQELLTGRTRLI